MADIVIKNYSGNEQEIFNKTIDKLFTEKITADIPVIVGVVGKSSVGKSAFILDVQDRIYKKKGINFLPFVEQCTLIKPTDYAPKMKAILFSKECKDIFTIQMDEAKFLVSSDEWQKFKNRATRTITATCRSIKPMIFFILAQKRSDIEARTRQTLDYYIEITRTPNQKPMAKISEVYEDKTYWDSPVFKVRPILISIQTKKGDSVTLIPKIRFSMPSKEIWDTYKSFETKEKTEEINELLTEMEKEAKKISGEADNTSQTFVKFLIDNPIELEKFGKNTKKGWKLNSKIVTGMGVSSKKINLIQNLLNESLEKFKEKELKKDE